MYPLLCSFGDLRVYSYPLFIGLSWGIAYQISKYLIHKKKLDFKGFNVFVLGLFISVWMGAKILFLLVSVNNNLSEYIISPNFWLGGGFVFYGGLLVGILYIFIYQKWIDKALTLQKIIVILPALAFGHSLGRVGCLLAGCCYGKVTSSFFSIVLHNASRHPVQLYESILLFFLGLWLIKLVIRNYQPQKIMLLYLLSYSLIRFMLEFLRGDKIRGLFMNILSTSQVISIIIILVSLVCMTLYRDNKNEDRK